MIRFLLRWQSSLLVVGGLLLAVSVWQLAAHGLKQDYRLEAFVAADDPAYDRFVAFMNEFTSNEFAVVAVHRDGGLTSADESTIAALHEECTVMPNVERTSSLFGMPAAIRTLLGDRLRNHPLVRGNLLSEDGATAAVLLQMAGERGGGAERRETVARIKRLVGRYRAEHPDLRFIIAGPYVTLIDMYEYVDHDLLVFSVAAFALMVVTLGLVFRRIAPMVYAGGVAAFAILTTLGVTVVLGIVTSLITQMLVILIIVLSVANCVHLAVAAEEVRVEQHNAAWRDRAKLTLHRMIVPCTAVMLTTAVGFGSVCISNIAPVRRFGLFMMLGLALGLVGALVGVILLSRFLKPPAAHNSIAAMLGAAARRALAHPVLVAATFTIALGLSLWGATFIRSESDFVKNFRKGTSVRQSYEFIERNLSPLGSVEIVARRRDGASVVRADAVAASEALGKDLVERFPMVKRALTPYDLLSLMMPGGIANDAQAKLALGLVRSVPNGDNLARNFFNTNDDAMRINFRCIEGYDVQRKLDACTDMETAAAQAFGPDYTVEVTGLYHFYAKLVRGLVRDQYRALGITVVAIAAGLWLVFRSVRITAIILLVNLLPLVLCVGAMGWTGVPINMTTAMMLSITLGIAVDDAVHYTWRYRRELAACGDRREAAVRTHRSVGKACVFTTVVIAGGFTILLLSRFLPTAHFGGLVGFNMLAALAADLVLLPLLLVRFSGD